MKKNLKCLTALCMAGAMISLTGCGSSSQSTSADTTAGSATSEATTSAESTASGTGSDRLGFPGLFFQQLFLHLPTGDHRPV